MKKLVILLGLWLLAMAANAQKKFPDSWVGQWKGRLDIISTAGIQNKQDSINVLFEVAPLSKNTYRWRTTYQTVTRPVIKDYRLIADTIQLGHYKIDEGDSIIMDSYNIGQKLYCTFEVEKSLFFSSYEFKGNEIIFEIVFGPFETPTKTGGVTVAAGEIPPVNVYTTQAIQRAVLKLQ